MGALRKNGVQVLGILCTNAGGSNRKWNAPPDRARFVAYALRPRARRLLEEARLRRHPRRSEKALTLDIAGDF